MAVATDDDQDALVTRESWHAFTETDRPIDIIVSNSITFSVILFALSSPFDCLVMPRTFLVKSTKQQLYDHHSNDDVRRSRTETFERNDHVTSNPIDILGVVWRMVNGGKNGLDQSDFAGVTPATSSPPHIPAVQQTG